MYEVRLASVNIGKTFLKKNANQQKSGLDYTMLTRIKNVLSEIVTVAGFVFTEQIIGVGLSCRVILNNSKYESVDDYNLKYGIKHKM